MTTRPQPAIVCYVLLVLQGSSTAVEVTERRVAAEGSSVLLRAPGAANASVIEWEYTRNTTPEFILQYYTDHPSPTIYSAYQGRVIFYPENGSILLQRLREADSGLYKATVDLMQHKARTTLLEVIKPVPQPELQCRSNLAGAPIELVCVVPEGTVASISWKKEGHPLPHKMYYLLAENTTVLQIRNGEKSDCGSYSCIISNAISWKEAALNLTVTGLSPPLHHVQRLAVVVLMLVAVPAVGIVTLLCQPMERRLGEEAQKYIDLSVHGLLCVSSLLLLATCIIWVQEEGLSAPFVLLGLFFFAAALGTARVAAALLWRPAAPNLFKTRVCHHVIWISIGPTTLTVNTLFTTLLLHNIRQLHERGCAEAVDLTTSYVLAAVTVLVTLLLLCYLRNKWKKMRKKQYATQLPPVTHTLRALGETQGQREEGERGSVPPSPGEPGSHAARSPEDPKPGCRQLRLYPSISEAELSAKYPATPVSARELQVPNATSLPSVLKPQAEGEHRPPLTLLIGQAGAAFP